MILPGATLGLVGGGQLGRMFCMAARNMDYQVTVLDPDPLSPAAEFATGHLNTAYTHPVSLDELAKTCAAVTTEFENAPSETLIALATKTTVRPSGHAVAIAQDRSAEKGFFQRNAFPVGPFAVVQNTEDIISAVRSIPFPAVLKTARFGYDGKGQSRINSAEQLAAIFAEWKGVTCVLEQFLPLKMEISVILARAEDGETAVFPVVENLHVNGILEISIAPARISAHLAAQARDIATQVAIALEYVGVLAVEFFVLADDTLLINEIAPRPHNSGHYTIDACRSTQFEQQVRVLCGLPLGDATQHSPAVMLNLLGDLWQGANYDISPDWSVLLEHAGAHLHLYGKRVARKGRKMGHVTVCDTSVEAALAAVMGMKATLGGTR
ncbi:MAG: 5-(carboxyamino)imidazole ribonucleotide synthase [Pseudomonadota bacterium]